MGKKLQSMDVTIHGVTKSYSFDPAIPVDSDDEGEASLEVLADAETTEVVLVSGIESATVSVSFSLTIEGEVELELDGYSLDGVESADDLRDRVESGDFEDVYDAIGEYIERNIEASDAQLDSVEVTCYDEDGDTVE